MSPHKIDVGSVLGEKRKYTILQPFTTTGGGLCQWTFAQRDDGKEMWLKQFLSPTYPPDVLTAALRSKKLLECAAFEAHHKGLVEALHGKSISGGNLVITEDFFRHGYKYYKVTAKVDVARLAIPEIATLPLDLRISSLALVGNSLRILHGAKIVHGDLKPANILIKYNPATGHSLPIAKLIDFDNSYFAGKPPPPDDIVGDPAYYSPELEAYVTKRPSVDPTGLGLASDIFTLGLIFSQFLTGGFPDYDKAKGKTPAIAVMRGARLRLPTGAIPTYLAVLANAMLHAIPSERPVIKDVLETLAKKSLPPSLALSVESAASPTAGKADSGSKRPHLVGTLLHKEPKEEPAIKLKKSADIRAR